MQCLPLTRWHEFFDLEGVEETACINCSPRCLGTLLVMEVLVVDLVVVGGGREGRAEGIDSFPIKGLGLEFDVRLRKYSFAPAGRARVVQITACILVKEADLNRSICVVAVIFIRQFLVVL